MLEEEEEEEEGETSISQGEERKRKEKKEREKTNFSSPNLRVIVTSIFLGESSSFTKRKEKKNAIKNHSPVGRQHSRK